MPNQSRPPRKFPGLSDETSAAIYAELDRIATAIGFKSPSVKVHSEAIVNAVAGDKLKLRPKPAGQRLLLPPPQSCSLGDSVLIELDASLGGVLTVTSSAVVRGTAVQAGLVNGLVREQYSTTGALEFVSDGSQGWYVATGAPGADGATGPTGPTGPTGTFVGATGSDQGYASFTDYRFADTGTTWTLASHIPDGNMLEFVLRGPGGGGASGCAASVASASQSLSNSAAGGQGAQQRKQFSRAYLVALIANGAITFNIPDGGAAGTAVTRAAGTGSLVGNGGNPASADATITAVDSNGRTFVLMSAGRGGGGRAHSTVTDAVSGGAGGGTLGAGTGGPSNGSTSDGGAPSFGGAVNNGVGAGDGGAGSTTSVSAGQPAGPGGGASGACGSQATANASAGGRNSNGGGGGGGGGGCSTTTPRNGGAGGGRGTSVATTGGGGASTSGSSGSLSAASAGLDGDEGAAGEGGGGGGCARATGANQTGSTGGAGGAGGGGGGGGGCAVADDTHTATSGAGGKGGEAQCIIIGHPGS